MTEIDLWNDDSLILDEDYPTDDIKTLYQIDDLVSNQVQVVIDDQKIHLFSVDDISEGDYHNFYNANMSRVPDSDIFHYSIPCTPINAFVLRYFLKGFDVIMKSSDDVKILADKANIIIKPFAKLSDKGNFVHIIIPNIRVYRDLLKKLDAYTVKNGIYQLPLAKVIDFEGLVLSMKSKLPKIRIKDEILLLNRDPIDGYDGTLESLKNIPVSVLNVVSANNQSWSSLKNSKKTLEEKMDDFGLSSLYDLLFWLPRRYIDKSKPQDIDDLVEGESATVIGVIDSASTLNSQRGGAVFMLKTHTGGRIRTTFFNQKWLLSKFKEGDEVLITGKMSWFNHAPQISGNSIEHADEAILVPIVPVYNQSTSKGITTYLIMSANRELLSRLGTIKLPEYFNENQKMSYYDALMELHFPSSLSKHYEAIDILAYYELVYMQLLILEEKSQNAKNVGLLIREGQRRLQAKAIKTLPFDLTISQKKALVDINKQLAGARPSSILLNADVGSGKTVVAQLACLRAVDAGFQAVLIGPTDILARQLFDSFKMVSDGLEKIGESIKVVYLGGAKTMSVKDKREVLKQIESGDADVIVGTHSLLADTVKFNNLGFVAIDEQQKFGAEQRSKLLSSREDGLIPDTLLQTATPIPRTTAQFFYGDIDMIELTDKPAGRLPIVTEWVKDNPSDFIEQLTNSVWDDIIQEADKGNQSFVVAPLVVESEKIDSASVERTYKSLTNGVLSNLRVGFVHGKMPKDSQQEEMRKFKNKEYDVLVSSTVVEVGVDIRNATRVVILSADRLGSASLHQIRGRVGRNDKPSKCYLISLGKTDSSQLRLQSLVDSNNGFDIAKADLENRGEGMLFDSQQSGKSGMLFADFSKHIDRIAEARGEAENILKTAFKKQALRDGHEKFGYKERML